MDSLDKLILVRRSDAETSERCQFNLVVASEIRDGIDRSADMRKDEGIGAAVSG